MNTPQHATRTELASTLQQSGLSVRAFCNDAGLPKTTVRRFLGGKVVRPSTHSQIYKALRAYQADRLAAVQSANAASRQCYLDGVTLVDDQIESEKSQMRQTIETQRENIKTLQEKLSESELEAKLVANAAMYHAQQEMVAMHDHALTIDATRQAHAVLMRQIEVEKGNFRKQGWTVWFLIALLAICCAVMSFGSAS